MTSATLSSLATWRDGGSKRAIIRFIDDVTRPGPGFVPPPARVAAFDNDGTLWCEKPLYAQADFLFHRWSDMAAANPELRSRQPYKAVVERDDAWLAAIADHVPEIIRGVAESCCNITSDVFEQDVAAFFANTRNPALGLPYTSLVYQPMLELMDLLTQNEFSIFICTGGGRDFVRVVAEDIYHIPRDRVIGSSSRVELRDGRPFRLPELEQPIDDGPGKPIHIWSRTGRLPLFAAGNSDGDIDMLETARFGLLLHHDDAAREFAYDTGAERALAEAPHRGWTVASIERDFASVF